MVPPRGTPAKPLLLVLLCERWWGLCGRWFGEETDSGGVLLGSGTHGLQSRTRSPPVVYGNPSSPVNGFTYSWGVLGWPGGRTMYWYGIVIRWGEQALQTTRPHFLYRVLSANYVVERRRQQRNEPAVVFPDKEAELRAADRTKRDL